MDLLLLIVGMVAVGVVMSALGGVIWKEPRPFGVAGDLAASVFTTVVIGLIDWFIIPAMGFSDTLKYLGVIFEPPLGALLVLWVVRKARD